MLRKNDFMIYGGVKLLIIYGTHQYSIYIK